LEIKEGFDVFSDRLAARDEPFGLEPVERLGRVGGLCSFDNLSVWEIPPKAGRGQNSPAVKLLKRPAREPWNERKDVKAVFNDAFTPVLQLGSSEGCR
jgi:hypothetical protein